MKIRFLVDNPNTGVKVGHVIDYADETQANAFIKAEMAESVEDEDMTKTKRTRMIKGTVTKMG